MIRETFVSIFFIFCIGEALHLKGIGREAGIADVGFRYIHQRENRCGEPMKVEEAAHSDPGHMEIVFATAMQCNQICRRYPECVGFNWMKPSNDRESCWFMSTVCPDSQLTRIDNRVLGYFARIETRRPCDEVPCHRCETCVEHPGAPEGYVCHPRTLAQLCPDCPLDLCAFDKNDPKCFYCKTAPPPRPTHPCPSGQCLNNGVFVSEIGKCECPKGFTGPCCGKEEYCCEHQCGEYLPGRQVLFPPATCYNREHGCICRHCPSDCYSDVESHCTCKCPCREASCSICEKCVIDRNQPDGYRCIRKNLAELCEESNDPRCTAQACHVTGQPPICYECNPCLTNPCDLCSVCAQDSSTHHGYRCDPLPLVELCQRNHFNPTYCNEQVCHLTMVPPKCLQCDPCIMNPCSECEICESDFNAHGRFHCRPKTLSQVCKHCDSTLCYFTGVAPSCYLCPCDQQPCTECERCHVDRSRPAGYTCNALSLQELCQRSFYSQSQCNPQVCTLTRLPPQCFECDPCRLNPCSLCHRCVQDSSTSTGYRCEERQFEDVCARYVSAPLKRETCFYNDMLTTGREPCCQCEIAPPPNLCLTTQPCHPKCEKCIHTGLDEPPYICEVLPLSELCPACVEGPCFLDKDDPYCFRCPCEPDPCSECERCQVDRATPSGFRCITLSLGEICQRSGDRLCRSDICWLTPTSPCFECDPCKINPCSNCETCVHDYSSSRGYRCELKSLSHVCPSCSSIDCFFDPRLSTCYQCPCEQNPCNNCQRCVVNQEVIPKGYSCLTLSLTEVCSRDGNFDCSDTHCVLTHSPPKCYDCDPCKLNPCTVCESCVRDNSLNGYQCIPHDLRFHCPNCDPNACYFTGISPECYICPCAVNPCTECQTCLVNKNLPLGFECRDFSLAQVCARSGDRLCSNSNGICWLTPDPPCYGCDPCRANPCGPCDYCQLDSSASRGYRCVQKSLQTVCSHCNENDCYLTGRAPDCYVCPCESDPCSVCESCLVDRSSPNGYSCRALSLTEVCTIFGGHLCRENTCWLSRQPPRCHDCDPCRANPCGPCEVCERDLLGSSNGYRCRVKTLPEVCRNCDENQCFFTGVGPKCFICPCESNLCTPCQTCLVDRTQPQGYVCHELTVMEVCRRHGGREASKCSEVACWRVDELPCYDCNPCLEMPCGPCERCVDSTTTRMGYQCVKKTLSEVCPICQPDLCFLTGIEPDCYHCPCEASPCTVCQNCVVERSTRNGYRCTDKTMREICRYSGDPFCLEDHSCWIKPDAPCYECDPCRRSTCSNCETCVVDYTSSDGFVCVAKTLGMVCSHCDVSECFFDHNSPSCYRCPCHQTPCSSCEYCTVDRQQPKGYFCIALSLGSVCERASDPLCGPDACELTPVPPCYKCDPCKRYPCSLCEVCINDNSPSGYHCQPKTLTDVCSHCSQPECFYVSDPSVQCYRCPCASLPCSNCQHCQVDRRAPDGYRCTDITLKEACDRAAPEPCNSQACRLSPTNPKCFECNPCQLHAACRGPCERCVNDPSQPDGYRCESLTLLDVCADCDPSLCYFTGDPHTKCYNCPCAGNPCNHCQTCVVELFVGDGYYCQDIGLQSACERSGTSMCNADRCWFDSTSPTCVSCNPCIPDPCDSCYKCIVDDTQPGGYTCVCKDLSEVCSGCSSNRCWLLHGTEPKQLIPGDFSHCYTCPCDANPCKGECEVCEPHHNMPNGYICKTHDISTLCSRPGAPSYCSPDVCFSVNRPPTCLVCNPCKGNPCGKCYNCITDEIHPNGYRCEEKTLVQLCPGRKGCEKGQPRTTCHFNDMNPKCYDCIVAPPPRPCDTSDPCHRCQRCENAPEYEGVFYRCLDKSIYELCPTCPTDGSCFATTSVPSCYLCPCEPNPCGECGQCKVDRSSQKGYRCVAPSRDLCARGYDGQCTCSQCVNTNTRRDVEPFFECQAICTGPCETCDPNTCQCIGCQGSCEFCENGYCVSACSHCETCIRNQCIPKTLDDLCSLNGCPSDGVSCSALSPSSTCQLDECWLRQPTPTRTFSESDCYECCPLSVRQECAALGFMHVYKNRFAGVCCCMCPPGTSGCRCEHYVWGDIIGHVRWMEGGEMLLCDDSRLKSSSYENRLDFRESIDGGDDSHFVQVCGGHSVTSCADICYRSIKCRGFTYVLENRAGTHDGQCYLVKNWETMCENQGIPVGDVSKKRRTYIKKEPTSWYCGELICQYCDTIKEGHEDKDTIRCRTMEGGNMRVLRAATVPVRTEIDGSTSCAKLCTEDKNCHSYQFFPAMPGSANPPLDHQNRALASNCYLFANTRCTERLLGKMLQKGTYCMERNPLGHTYR